MKISLFKSLYSTKDVSYRIEIDEALERIKNGSSKELIELIRKGDKEKKKQLPAVCFNGTFTSRNDNSLIEHSGLCILDFDKYPDTKTMTEERSRIEDDLFTFAVFTSPSGNGLKVLVRIPKCDKDEHKLYFKGLEKHFDSEYFDEKCSNVSRVCFESYDPDIFVNHESIEFTDKAIEEGYSVTEKIPVLPLNNENEIINRLMKWWDDKFGLAPDNWNNNLYILAGAFCSYGIDEDFALNYIVHNVTGSNMPENDVQSLTRSAYKRIPFGTKYFEDTTTVKRIKQKVQKGDSIDAIVKSFPGIDKSTIEEVNEEVKKNSSIFWTAIVNKQGVETISINPFKFKSFLEENGFNKYYPEGGDTPLFVRHEQNIVNTTSIEKIKDFVLDHLKGKNEWSVWNYVAKSSILFSEKHLNMLDNIALKMLQDTKEHCYLYYKNGVVKIGKKKIDFLSYIEVDGFVWQKHIIGRDYVHSDNIKNDFQDLVSKVSNDDSVRLKSLENTIGYLMHSFKDKTDQKAIILNDQEINDDPNGGSGKSLMLTALSYFKKMVTIDGKTFDPTNSQFVYQRVDVDTQVLAFDDTKKNFNFEQLFPLVTGGITVNKKNKDEIFIPFERSPKIIITTNYVINGSGGSHDRRRHEVEFYQYFSSNHSPLDEYGRLIFDSWSEEDWISFDNYMISITQTFLNEGLTQTVSINAEVKRFIQQTSKDFYDWIEEGNLRKDARIYTTDTVKLFKEDSKTSDFLNNRTFLNWVNKYCELNKFELVKSRDHIGRYFIIKTQDEEIKNVDECPF